MSNRFGLPFAREFDSTGDSGLAGAKLEFFLSGTSAQKDTFSDSALTTPNANPVIADAEGRWSDIFLDGSYKVTLRTGAPVDPGDPVEDTLIWTADPVFTGASEAQVQDSSATYGATDTGSADTYVTTLNPTLTAYTEGQVFQFKAANANTGASTINIDTLGAKAIKKFNGDALIANDIEVGGIYTIIYDGTNFQMANPSQIAHLGANTYSSAAAENEWIQILRDTGNSNTISFGLNPSATSPNPLVQADDIILSPNKGAADTGVFAIVPWSTVALGIQIDNVANAIDLVGTTINKNGNSIIDVSDEATQVEQEAAASAVKYTSPANQHLNPSAISAWASFQGSSTIDESFNATSVDDNGTGNYDINWSITMASAVYGVLTGSNHSASVDGGSLVGPSARTTTTTTIRGTRNTGDSASVNIFADPNPTTIALLGDIAP